MIRNMLAVIGAFWVICWLAATFDLVDMTVRVGPHHREEAK